MRNKVSNNYNPTSWLKVETGLVHFNPSQKIFAKPIPCSEVLQLQLPVGIPDILYGECHIAHIDQLKVIDGKAIVLIVYNKLVYYIPLTKESDLLIILTGTWHSVINMSDVPTNYQNWLLRKRISTPKDYYPTLLQHKFDYQTASKGLLTNSILTNQI